VFVLDASLTLAWAFSEEETDFARAALAEVLQHVVVAPGVWPLEIANAVVAAARHGRFGANDVPYFIELVRGLDVEVDDRAHLAAFDAILELAYEHGLSSYDAAYLELALRLEAPLATLDAGLARAARAAGVELLLQA
jgi:predicted nucleic acid-binding protein